MGVKRCARIGCDNIMCDTYINYIGYICSDCKSEFKEYLNKDCLNPTTESEINREVKNFILTPKDTYIDREEMTIDEFFDKNTK